MINSYSLCIHSFKDCGNYLQVCHDLFWANPVWTLQHMFLLFPLFIIVSIISCRITKTSIVITALNSSWMAKIMTETNQKRFSTSVWISYLTSLLSYFCLPLLIQLIQFNPTFPNQDSMISKGTMWDIEAKVLPCSHTLAFHSNTTQSDLIPAQVIAPRNTLAIAYKLQ